MKVKVLKKFIDKRTNKINEVGSIIDISKERYEEITAVGNYVEEIKTVKSKAVKKETEIESE